MVADNETLVERIRGGYSVSENMQLLYENNLPLIKRIIRLYTAYEPMEDLLQEAFFGLWTAVQRYESSKEVQFMTYAQYWILSAVRRYIRKCGSEPYPAKVDPLQQSRRTDKAKLWAGTMSRGDCFFYWHT